MTGLRQPACLPLPQRAAGLRALVRVLAPTMLLLLLPCLNAGAADSPMLNNRVKAIMQRVSPRLEAELGAKGFTPGAPIYIRIFKLPGELEVWLKDEEKFRLFKTYPICKFSGYPGPKRYEGDWQSPEGFYAVTARQMNPNSSYHLSFNIGYPNEYDKSLSRSGSNIMVHGDCSSKGCFAMNNYRMEEIYTMAHAALAGGQEQFAVHVFPFAMTDENMRKFKDSPWIDFWNNLREGYLAFEMTRQVPEIRVAGGRYVVGGPVRIALDTKRQNSYLGSLRAAKSSR